MAEKEKEWYDMTAAELAKSADAQEARRVAFANTFYLAEDGRKVLADLRKRALGSGGLDPVAIVAMVEMMQYIKECCGIDNENDVVDAEAELLK